MSTLAATKSFQPVECIDASSPDGRDVVNIGYSNVKGSQLVVSVVDNFAALPVLSSGQDNRYWPALLVTVFGFVQGYGYCLKRQTVRMISGPMFLFLPPEAFFTALAVRATNITGGTLGARQDPNGGIPAPTAANGFSIMCQVQFAAQEGMGRGI